MSPNETFLIANGTVDELGDLQLGLNDNVSRKDKKKNIENAGKYWKCFFYSSRGEDILF